MKTHISRAIVVVALAAALTMALLLNAYGAEKTYDFYTGQSIQVGWDVSTGALFYNVGVRKVGEDTMHTSPSWQGITSTTATVITPRVGDWELVVQACNNSDPPCSGWASSSLAGAPVTWVINATLAPPTGGIIERGRR